MRGEFRMIKSRKKKLVALGVALAISLTGLIAAPAANAGGGSNCNLKSTPAKASCDSITYGALHRVSTLDKLNPVGGYTESQMAYIVQGQLYRFAANGYFMYQYQQ